MLRRKVGKIKSSMEKPKKEKFKVAKNNKNSDSE